MLGVNEIRVLTVYVKQILEHAEDKARDGEDLGKGSETEWAG